MPNPQPGIFSLERLDDRAQELVICRTKGASKELDDDQGNVREHGLMFVGFTGEQQRLHRMLLRMAGTEDGVRDALTRFSTPLTGANYLVPSTEALAQFVVDEDDSRAQRA